MRRRSFLLGLGLALVPGRAAVAQPSPLPVLSIIRAKPGGPIPVGCVEQIVAGFRIPDGWLPCDGRLVDHVLYPELRELMDGGRFGHVPDCVTHYSEGDPDQMRFPTVGWRRVTAESWEDGEGRWVRVGLGEGCR